MDMDDLIAGFAHAVEMSTLIAILIGVILGYIVGVLPGISRPTALAVAIPITFYLSPVAAIAFLIAISKASGAGGAITAILINTPGEPSSAATCLDGYPLTKKGKGEKALKIALYASVIGDLISTIVLIIIAIPIARFALLIGPVELVAILILALTAIAALSGPSLTKGLMAGFIGIFVSMVGLDAETATPRFTFGFIELYSGLPVIAVVVGMLGFAEMIFQFSRAKSIKELNMSVAANKSINKEDRRVSFSEFFFCLPTIFRGSFIGIVVGILPGLGATVGAYLSYASARRFSKSPEKFGHGALEGVAAAESADNATVPASLIPLFALGIPGTVGAAILIGAFTIHGITPGPRMFEQNTVLMYAVFASMIITSIALLFIGSLGLRILSKIALLPQKIIVSSVIFLCIAGSFIENNSMFGVYVMFIFGILGFLFRVFGFSIVSFLIGFLVGPMFEMALRQSTIILRGNISNLVNHPFAVAILFITVFAIWRMIRVRA